MHILVTGGAGFIGSHLVYHLLADNHTVIVLDSLVTGRAANLAHHKNSDALTLYEVDISDFESIQPLFENVDWVFHLAALADIVPSIQNPKAYHQSNVDGTFSVLQASQQAGVKRFVYAASSSCYGIPNIYPTPETAPIAPQYPYALTKYIGEAYVMHYAQVYGLPSVSLRFFNVFGPRSRTTGTYGAVFGVFLKQKLADKPLTIVGDGTQTRDFTYVTDVANALVKAVQSDVSGEIFNVGSGNTYSVNDLAKLIGGETTYIPKRPGEPDSTFADISKIRNVLGWEPTVPFADGVKTMLDQIHLWQDAPLWDSESIADATRDWFHYLGKRG